MKEGNVSVCRTPIGVILFNIQMGHSGEQSSGGTTDGFGIFLSGKGFSFIVDFGTESVDDKFVGESLDALAAADAGDVADLLFVHAFVKAVAVNVNRSIRRNQLDDIAGACRNAVAAADAEFFMNNGKRIDHFDCTERTLVGTSSKPETAGGTAFETAADHGGGNTISNTDIGGRTFGLIHIAAAADDGFLFGNAAGFNTEGTGNGGNLFSTAHGAFSGRIDSRDDRFCKVSASGSAASAAVRAGKRRSNHAYARILADGEIPVSDRKRDRRNQSDAGDDKYGGCHI